MHVARVYVESGASSTASHLDISNYHFFIIWNVFLVTVRGFYLLRNLYIYNVL